MEGSVVQYTWKASWGPCKPEDLPCTEVLTVTRAGAVTYTLKDAARTATLSNADILELKQFLDAPSLLGAISDTKDCPTATFDRTEMVSLAFADGTMASKDVVACVGAQYDAISQWTSRLRAYFS